MNTIAQERSKYALDAIKELQRKLDKALGNPDQIKSAKADFATLTKGLPAMILQNGFGQALAFLLAKGSDKNDYKPNDKHLYAFDMIAGWLVQRKILKNPDRESVVTELAEMEQNLYLRGQEEALHFLEWVKRYADSGLF